MKTYIFASAEFLKLPNCKASYEMKRRKLRKTTINSKVNTGRNEVAGVRLGKITCDCMPQCDLIKGTNKFKPEFMEFTLICLHNDI